MLIVAWDCSIMTAGAIQSESDQLYAESYTTEAVAGATSDHRASGSTFSRQPPSGPRMRNLYLSPGAASGTNSSHTPLWPIDRIGQPVCGPQPVKSPTTRTPR